MKSFLATGILLTLVSSGHAAADDWYPRLMSDDISTFEIAKTEIAQWDSATQARHVTELVNFLKTAAGHTREERHKLRTVTESLGLIGRPARPAVPWMIKWLNHPDQGFDDRDIMQALSRIGATPETVDIFIGQLNSSANGMASYATEALGKLDAPSPKVVKVLLEKLGTPKDTYLQMETARALADLHPWSDADIERLAGYLNAPEPSLEYAAAWLWQQVFPGKPLDRRKVYHFISHTMATANCKVDGRSFQLIIKSFSGDPVENDETVWVLNDAGDPIFADFNGNLDMFNFVSADPAQPSVCDVLAFKDDQGDIVVPMQRDNRPFGDKMAGLLYDPRTHRVLASEHDFGEVPTDHPRVEPLSNGFSFEERAQPSDSGSCTEGDCGKFHGKKIQSNTDEWIGVWWDIVHKPQGARWHKRLNVQKTWAASSLQKYFHTPDEFAQAFGLDPVRNVVKTFWYRHLALSNGEHWFCVAPAREQTTDDTLCCPDAP